MLASLDPWPTWMVKDNLDFIIPLLTDIVKKSMLEGHMPDSLKNAVLKPLLKKPGLDENC
jgi:hypothetical protein